MTSSSSTTRTRTGASATSTPYEHGQAEPALDTVGSARAPVAQGIEHRPPEAVAQVRILPGARSIPRPDGPVTEQADDSSLRTPPGRSLVANGYRSPRQPELSA